MAVMGGATAPSRRKAWLCFLLGFFRSRGPWKRVMKRGPPGRWSGLTWDERGEPPSGELNMIMTQLEDSLYLDLKQNALYLRSLFLFGIKLAGLLQWLLIGDLDRLCSCLKEVLI